MSQTQIMYNIRLIPKNAVLSTIFQSPVDPSAAIHPSFTIKIVIHNFISSQLIKIMHSFTLIPAESHSTWLVTIPPFIKLKLARQSHFS